MGIKEQFIKNYESYDLNQLKKRLSELTTSDFYNKYNENLQILEELEKDPDSTRDTSPESYTELDSYFKINEDK